MKKHLTSGPLAQAVDLPCCPPRAQRAAMDGIEDRELDLTQRLCRAHSPSLRRRCDAVGESVER